MIDTNQSEEYRGDSLLGHILGGMIGLTGAVLLFLFLFIPFSYTVKPIKVILLSVLLLVVVLSILYKGRIHLSKEVMAVSAFFVVLSSLMSFYGALQGAPRAFDYFRLYAVWPAVYVLLFSILSRRSHLRLVLITLIAATIAVSGYGILYVLTSLAILPKTWFIDFQGQTAIQTAAIGFHEGFVEYRLLSITGMPFLIPFIMAALVTWPRKISPVPRSLLWIAFVLSVIAMIFTSRRALFLVVAFSPVIIFGLQYFISGDYAPEIRRRRRIVIILGILLVPVVIGSINFFYDIDFGVMLQDVQTAFDPSEDKGARKRVEQMGRFSSEIAERPFFGSGLGASISDIVIDISKNPEGKQTFEMMYFTLLFHVGIMGFLLYCGGIAWLYFRAISMFRSADETGLLALPVFVGCATFLIANATNPYLSSFEFMWTIFLPVGIINMYLLQNRENTAA